VRGPVLDQGHGPPRRRRPPTRWRTTRHP